MEYAVVPPNPMNYLRSPVLSSNRSPTNVWYAREYTTTIVITFKFEDTKTGIEHSVDLTEDTIDDAMERYGAEFMARSLLQGFEKAAGELHVARKQLSDTMDMLIKAKDALKLLERAINADSEEEIRAIRIESEQFREKLCPKVKPEEKIDTDEDNDQEYEDILLPGISDEEIDEDAKKAEIARDAYEEYMAWKEHNSGLNASEDDNQKEIAEDAKDDYEMWRPDNVTGPIW